MELITLGPPSRATVEGGPRTVREDLAWTDEEGGFRMIRNPPSRRVWGSYTPAATAAGSAAISRARSSSLMPPQTP